MQWNQVDTLYEKYNLDLIKDYYPIHLTVFL